VSTAAKSTDTYACPPSGTRENDSLACAGSQIKQVNAVTATVPFTHVVPSLGSAIVARAAAPGSYSTATAERDAVSGKNGLMDVQASRTLGDVYLAGFPTSGMTAPTGMSTTNTLSTNYCMTLTGYNDTAHVYAGESIATTPLASVGGGTFSYWNSATSGYANVPVTSTTLESLAFQCSTTQIVGGKSVTWRVTVRAGDITHAQVPAYTDTTSTPATVPLTHLETEATVQPIHIKFQYELIVDSVKEVDLTVSVDPGTLTTRAVYGPPPTAG